MKRLKIILVLIALITLGATYCHQNYHEVEKHHTGIVICHDIMRVRDQGITYITVVKSKDGSIHELRGLEFFGTPVGQSVGWVTRNWERK